MTTSAYLSRRTVLLTAAFVTAAVVPRLLWHRFLDPFEDGYQNWWIASTLVETGRYEDLFSGMTRGNWLPGYHLFAAGFVAIGGHAMPLLKAANLVVSLGTAGIVYRLARPRGSEVALLAAFLFVLNPADIVIASFATPESLTLLTAFAGVLLVEQRPLGARRSLFLASAAFLVAATLRYEAWIFLAVYAASLIARKRIPWREGAVLVAPAVAFAATWWVWTSQYGFLPAIVIGQTSTDVRFKETVGALAPAGDRISGFLAWYLGWTPFALVATAWGGWKERASAWTAILVIFLAGIVAYTALGFGHPSARYVHLTIPIVCIYSASALVAVHSRMSVHRNPRPLRRLPVAATVLLSCLLVALVVAPSPSPGTMLQGMQRAGTFLNSFELPEGRILLTESPIAAYYSGFPGSRMMGSSLLSSDPTEAEQFMIERVAYVVMVTVPYYRLRSLFPDLADGKDGHHLRLLLDATGPEYELGAPRVLVFEVEP